MYKIITEDERYVIIVTTYKNYNQYHIFETDDFIVEYSMEKEASEFHDIMIREDQKPSIGLCVKWDGCSNMNTMIDGVLIHFCEENHMKSFYEMLVTCYNDAEKRFDFNSNNCYTGVIN